MLRGLRASLVRLVALTLLSAAAVQVYFLARVASLNVFDPQSTTFQRSEAGRLLFARGNVRWSQEWIDYAQISPHLKRAVIASEDAGFVEHSGVEWDAIEQAFERNQTAQERAERNNRTLERSSLATQGARGTEKARPARIKLVGGSTISQQLAKNLFLSSERNFARKGQELIITLMLEALLSKQRILEIYLNHVEWGAGVFGAQAAARHYFRVDATNLSPMQAAQLAVFLPAPKRFEKRPYSQYVLSRAATVVARMDSVEVP